MRCNRRWPLLTCLLLLDMEQFMITSLRFRSASNFQLKKYESCLADIRLAIEAGYPTNIVYKLYIRQCKCLLELGKISDAQVAFDKAIDAIDRYATIVEFCLAIFGV